MTQQSIISRILDKREYTNKQGESKIAWTIEFKTAYTNRNGQICYDFYQGTWLTGNTDTDVNNVNALVGKEVQIVAYFNVRDVACPPGKMRHFQDCFISEMYHNIK